MHYQFTVLTISTVIPTGNDGPAPFAPWADGQPIVLTDPRLSTLTISDDDPVFRSGFYTIDEADQRLVDPVVFGHGAAAQTVPAGTQLSNFIGSVITSDTGGSFNVLFPRGYVPDDLGDEFGGRYSVLVIPVPGPPGSPAPVFDPTDTFTFTRIQSLQRVDDGLPYPAPPPTEGVPCFAQGTMIQTPSGPRAVQTLHPGDLLTTLDHGAQPVLWVGHRRLTAQDLDLCPHHRPIRIAAHALGRDCPAHDLTVSPQHRMLIRSRIAERMTGQPEVLVAARHLVGLPGITVLQQAPGVTYWHILTRRHEVVQADGAWTETLLPGPMAMQALGPENRRRITTLLDGRDLEPARHLLPGRQARTLSQRHAANARPLLDA